MKLILQGHEERYTVYEILQAYLPRIKAEPADTVPDDGEDYVLSRLTEENGAFIFHTVIYYNGTKREYSLSRPDYCKDYFKQSFQEIAEEVFGIRLPWGALTGIRPAKIVRTQMAEGKSDEQIHRHLLEYYRTTPEKATLAMQVAKAEEQTIAQMTPHAVSLYIGIPFCPTRCLYCSFTSQSVAFSAKLVEPYLEALYREIAHTATLLKRLGLSVETVYMGGGTPTSLTASQLDALLCQLYEHFDLSGIREFTIEAGRPDTIDAKKLAVIRRHGVHRISINPQTMNAHTLEVIGRRHTPQQVLDCFALAREQGFSHINMDLIAGLPGESPEDFSRTLDAVLPLSPESITIHTMCIKRSSYLAEQYDMYTVSSANAVGAMLDEGRSRLTAQGMHPYYMYRQKNMLGNLENVGYCLPGHECLYNVYIMEEVQTIVALGAGGSTKTVTDDLIRRSFNVKEVYEYIKRIDEMCRRKDDILTQWKGEL